MITYCNIGCVVVEDSGDILIWEGPSRVTYQQTSLPYSTVTHHHTLNNTILFSTRGVSSSYLDGLHFAEYLSFYSPTPTPTIYSLESRCRPQCQVVLINNFNVAFLDKNDSIS